jgi:hypothetical protein
LGTYLGYPHNFNVNKPKNWHKVVKSIILGFLLITVLISAIAVLVNIFDIQVPIFNPPPPIANRYISMGYPQKQPFLMALHINLTTSGDFVQGQPVNVNVTGWIKKSLLENLTTYIPSSNHSGINVGFKEAPLLINAEGLGFDVDEPEFSVNSPQGAMVVLMLKISVAETEMRLYSLPQKVKWLSQGDYHPEISFFTGDASEIKQEEIVYDDIVMHIGSTETLQAARYNRINEVLSIVLVVFAFVEVSKMIYESFFKNKN